MEAYPLPSWYSYSPFSHLLRPVPQELLTKNLRILQSQERGGLHYHAMRRYCRPQAGTEFWQGQLETLVQFFFDPATGEIRAFAKRRDEFDHQDSDALVAGYLAAKVSVRPPRCYELGLPEIPWRTEQPARDLLYESTLSFNRIMREEIERERAEDVRVSPHFPKI